MDEGKPLVFTFDLDSSQVCGSLSVQRFMGSDEIVAFSFGKGAYEEVARAKNDMNLDIRLKTVEDILKET